jgi:hypothetical protein
MLLKQVANGATIIAIKSCDTGSNKIVLCIQPEHIYQYVTWLMDEDENTYLGHYFFSIQEAVKDFNDRR